MNKCLVLQAKTLQDFISVLARDALVCICHYVYNKNHIYFIGVEENTYVVYVSSKALSKEDLRIPKQSIPEHFSVFDIEYMTVCDVESVLDIFKTLEVTE